MSVEAALKLASKLAAAAISAPERMMATMIEVMGRAVAATQMPLWVKDYPEVSVAGESKQLAVRSSAAMCSNLTSPARSYATKEGSSDTLG